MENKKENQVVKFLSQLDIYAASLVMLFLLILTFVNVFMRYVMRSPIAWVDEMQLFLFLWIVYLAAGAAFRYGSHIAVEIVVDSLPPKAKRFCEILAFVISLIILIYLMIQSNAYYMQLIHTNKIAPLLRVSFRYIYAVIPIGNVLMIVSMIYYYIGELFLKKDAKKEVDNA